MSVLPAISRNFATTFAFDGVLPTAVVTSLTSNSGDLSSNASAHVSSMSSQMSVSKMTGIFLRGRDAERAAEAPDVSVSRKTVPRATNAIIVLNGRFAKVLVPLIVCLLNSSVLMVSSRANIM